jgi:hypothetical protein
MQKPINGTEKSLQGDNEIISTKAQIPFCRALSIFNYVRCLQTQFLCANKNSSPPERSKKRLRRTQS